MKKLLFLLLIWMGINSFKTTAPVVEATLGANVPLNTNIRQMLGKKEGVIIVGNSSGDNQSLSFYDEKTMQLLSEKKIYGKEISAEDVKYYTPYQTLALKNTIVLIFSSTGKNKKNGFYAKAFDYKGNALTAIVPVNEHSFAPAEAIKMQPVSPETNYYDSRESFVISSDSLSWAAYSIPLTPVTTGDESFRMTVLDEQAKILAAQDVSLPYKDKAFGFSSIMLDKNKAAYILGYVKQTDGSYRYILSKVDAANAFKVTEAALPVPYYIKTHVLKWSNPTELRINGVYSKMAAGKITTGVQGCFALTVNTTSLSAGTVETYVFPASITDKMDRKPEKDLSIYGLSIDKVVTKNDGGYYVLLDHYYTDETVRGGIAYTVPEGMSNTIYHSDELIILSYDKTNKVIWSSIYKKAQQRLGSNGMMMQDAILYQNGLVILYNESEKNLQNNTNEYYLLSPDKMKAAMLYVDDKGGVSRSVVGGLSTDGSKQLISMRAFSACNKGPEVYSDVFTFNGKTLKALSFAKLQVR
jgi:hypothetical protein